MGHSGGFGKLSTIVGRGEIELGAERDDAARVEIAHPAVIAELDPRYVDRFGDAGHLVDFAQIVRQVVIVGDAPQIALKVAVIDRVEPHQGWKQTQIGLGEAVTDQIALMAEALLDLVEGAKQLAETRLVSPLATGKAAAINPIVYCLIDEGVDLFDRTAQ